MPWPTPRASGEYAPAGDAKAVSPDCRGVIEEVATLRAPRRRWQARGSKARRRTVFWVTAGTSGVLTVAVCLSHAATSLGYGSIGLRFPPDTALGEDVERGHTPQTRRLDMYPNDGILQRPYNEDPHRFPVVLLHIIGIGYMLLGLNTVCDIYFTGALEVMVTQWHIKPDVAGATFMAAGGSAPELFTSLIGAVLENDVGFGTIVGSAVFNVLFVIGLCGYVAKTEISLTWWPLFRDCTFYIFGLFLLAVCVRSDSGIVAQEAGILFAGYLLYCTVMFFNPLLEEFVDCEYLRAKRKCAKGSDATGDTENSSELGKSGEPHGVAIGNPCLDTRSDSALGCSPKVQPAERIVQISETGVTGYHRKRSGSQAGKTRMSAYLTEAAHGRHEDRMMRYSAAPFQVGSTNQLDSPNGSDAGNQPRGDPTPSLAELGIHRGNDCEQGSNAQDDKGDEEEEEDEEADLLDMPSGRYERLIWYISLPIYVPLYFGVPKPTPSWFLAAFFVSLVWIAVFSFLLVWWVEILGQVLEIPILLMGFTVLAAGTSIPDAVSSIAVARMGEGDMAVSSSIGSNIFDILVGLPVPWMIKTAFIEGGGYMIQIRSPFLTFYVLMLLFMVFCVVVSIHFIGWKLNKLLGVCMALLYAIFLAVAIIVESQRPGILRF